MADFKIEKVGNVYVWTVKGDLNMQHAAELEEIVMYLIARRYMALWENRN